MTLSRALTVLALSTFVAPAALAQDATAFASFQESLDRTYICSLENTWETLTTYEPALDELDLSWDEQLDMVEELAETGTSSSVDLASFGMPDIDVEGVLFTEIYAGLGGGSSQGGVDVHDWANEGFLPVRTATGLRAAYMPDEVQAIHELEASSNAMVMLLDLSAFGFADSGKVAALSIEPELLTLPIDEPLLDYADLIELDVDDSDDAEGTYTGTGESGTDASPSGGESDAGHETDESSTGDASYGDDDGRGEYSTRGSGR
jgi:hypothetical protein